ncbi:Do family serine endopeptidase [Gellertiella hungarica]
MITRIKGLFSVKSALQASAAGIIAAGVIVSGVPQGLIAAHADPVAVQAPQVPSFADVVGAVSPAVVSVRVQTNIDETADNGNGFSFNFGGEGFDQLPDDHPLKRFFKEFGGPGFDGDGNGRRNPHKMPHGKGHLRPTAQGSGFFISADGYVVTNNHVVSDGEAYTVVMNDGTELDAKLVGKDSRTDLAVLKVDDKAKRTFTYVKFADDSKVRVGDWVVAVGNPFGLGGTVTAGIISARGRDIGSGPYDDYLQVDAAVNKGNSGGPTFNLSGEVVGINTAIFSPSGGNVGIAFAIPSTVAQGVVNDLIKNGSVSRGWLGVQIQPVTRDIADSLGLSEASGALVVAPQEGSPGQKAGMKKGDVVTAVNGEPIKDARDLAKRIAGFRPGSKAEVTIWRDGKSEVLSLTLGALPADQTQAQADEQQGDEQTQPSTDKALAGLGLSVAPAEDGTGVTVTDVDPVSDAADKGMKQGETITSVNNQEVKTPEDIEKVIDKARNQGRPKALFQVESQEGTRFIALDISNKG